jgi:hypothetical protein
MMSCCRRIFSARARRSATSSGKRRSVLSQGTRPRLRDFSRSAVRLWRTSRGTTFSSQARLPFCRGAEPNLPAAPAWRAHADIGAEYHRAVWAARSRGGRCLVAGTHRRRDHALYRQHEFRLPHGVYFRLLNHRQSRVGTLDSHMDEPLMVLAMNDCVGRGDLSVHLRAVQPEPHGGCRRQASRSGPANQPPGRARDHPARQSHLRHCGQGGRRNRARSGADGNPAGRRPDTVLDKIDAKGP